MVPLTTFTSTTFTCTTFTCTTSTAGAIYTAGATAAVTIILPWPGDSICRRTITARTSGTAAAATTAAILPWPGYGPNMGA